MAYSIFGFIKDTSCNPVKFAKVYPYFKKVDSASSPSKWTNIPYTSDSNGYYAFDVEDAQMLGVTGSYRRGTDKIYLAVVFNKDNPLDQELNSLTFSHCLFIEHIIGQDDFVEINLDIHPKRSPVVTTSAFPNTNLLTRTNYTMSENSYADYSWTTSGCHGTSVSQKLIYDLVPIFDGHQTIDTIYDWGETVILRPNSNSSVYQYDRAGVYNLQITTREKWNTQTILTKQVQVKYNKPVVDFNWTPTSTNSWQTPRIKGQEELTFNNTSYDIDNRTFDETKWGSEVYSYTWTITDTNQDGSDNTQVYSNQKYNFKPKHIFQSPGTKTITLELYWNDGFNSFVEKIVKTIEIYKFDVVPNFVWDKIPNHRNDPVTFSSTTTGDLMNIVHYDWYISDNFPAPGVDLYTFNDTETSIFNEGSPDNTQRIDNSKVFLRETNTKTFKFHSVEEKIIKLVVHFDDGWGNIETKEITKTLTPNKYDIQPEFVFNKTPQGRHDLVVCTNTTNYLRDTFDLGYTVDWEISDFYSEYNLDNPTPGFIYDNSVSLVNVNKSTIVEHYFQNPNSNNVLLTIRYDNGYQMVTKRTQKQITPIVFPNPVPDFVWDKTPKDRFDLVTFSNTTSDPFNRFRAYDWNISDRFNKYNPENPQYGIDVTINTQSIIYNNNKELQPKHKFQDSIQEPVFMRYYFDDGFCERSIEVTKTISKSNYSIIPNFSTSPTPINNGFFGKNEILFQNSSSGDTERMLDEKWEWNDREFGTNIDSITVRNNEPVNKPQPFTFQSPSRKPFSATDKSVAQNINKTVSLEVRIDTGWRVDTDGGEYSCQDNLSGDGGQVYFLISKNFEASPYEVESNISYKCNINKYSH